MATRAVCFDVDFTLIFPGPTFRGEGYQAFCARYGMIVDASAFERAVASAAPLLHGPGDLYDADVLVKYTRHIIEQMGGEGEGLDACAREIYEQWALCHHFELYPEAADVLRQLAAANIRVGLISNAHRSLASFESHFELHGLIGSAIWSSEHGFMKPNPSIFRAALDLLHVEPQDAVMVGDSVAQDVKGALGIGMRAVLVHRADEPHPEAAALEADGVAVIRTLRELPAVLARW
jgi:HAD superfamily hydrolase (TIGR01549 family)